MSHATSETHEVDTDQDADGPSNAQRGAVAVIVAITLMPLLLIASYATDLGLWLNRSQQIQRAADLAALAGAGEMPNATKAQAVAEETLRRNGFIACPWAGCDPDITAVVEFPEPGQIRVRVADNKVPAFLADPVTGDLSMSRTATSTYLPELALASPDNRFGAESVPVAPTDQQLFASVPGLGVRTQDGSPFMTCPGSVPATWSGCGAANPTYDGRGAFFAIDVGPEDVGLITVDLFDAGFDPASSCAWPNGTCDIDAGGRGGESTITFEVLASDTTPWDWYDNATTQGTCTRAYDPTNSAATFTTWTNLCSFNAGTPGLYVLNVRTSSYRPWAVAGGATAYANDNGIYNYSLRVTSSNAAGDPELYGLGAAAFFTAVTTSLDASYWLAEVDEAYRGKTLQFDIYDPGELPANSALQLRMPDDTAPACETMTLDYRRANVLAGPTANGNCRVVVTDTTTNVSLFNGLWLRMEIEVPSDYTCGPGPTGCFWYMKVDLDQSISPPENGTEKSLFTAQVLGDPIRLIE